MRSKTLNEPANHYWNEVRVNSNEFSVAGKVEHIVNSTKIIISSLYYTRRINITIHPRSCRHGREWRLLR